VINVATSNDSRNAKKCANGRRYAPGNERIAKKWSGRNRRLDELKEQKQEEKCERGQRLLDEVRRHSDDSRQMMLAILDSSTFAKLGQAPEETTK
jgi:hypothetical protein